MPAALIALSLAGEAARAATPLEAGGIRYGASYVGADASVAAGADSWTGGGGPAALAQLSGGGSWSGNGPWSSAVQAGSWLELVPGMAFDGHFAALQLRNRSGLGGLATATGSASVGWVQGAGSATAEAGIGPLRIVGSAGPVGRVGRGGAGAGGTGGVDLGIERGPIRPAIAVRGSAWATGNLPEVVQAAAWAQVQPVRAVTLTPSASIVISGPGPATPIAGLPAGGSRVGRVGIGAAVALGRTLRLQADAAWEAGTGYRRGVAFGGLAAQLGRARARACTAVAAGTVVLRLDAPEAAQVAVAGSFNGWSPVPMVRDGDRWSVAVALSPGTYEYVYLVDGEPRVPPEAALTRPDGWGGTNGVLEVSDAPCDDAPRLRARRSRNRGPG